MSNEYRCKRCGYTTTQKQNLKNHLTKKKECEGKINEISREKLLNELDISKNKICICEQCEKEFRDKWVLERHTQNCKVDETEIHKLKNIITEMKDVIISQRELIDNSQKTIINNNNSINNITNNINITNINIKDLRELRDINYGKRDKELLKEIINSEDEMYIKMAKKFNFNEKIPENLNILVNDKESGKCYVYIDDEFSEISSLRMAEITIEENKKYLLKNSENESDKESVIYQGEMIDWGARDRNKILNKIIEEGYKVRKKAEINKIKMDEYINEKRLLCEENI
jgi:hypothetical protein